MNNSLFKIEREERGVALVSLLVVGMLQVLMVCASWDVFAWRCDQTFIDGVRFSGFDPNYYRELITGNPYYNALRHPLIFFLLYPLYLVNLGLGWLTGVNCAVPLVALLHTFCGTYSLLFLYRTLRQLVGLQKVEACTLTAMFLGFAYVMLAVMVPDHFCLSMFWLTLTLYWVGRRMKQHRPLRVWQACCLFLLTAGTTLTNGVKTGLALLFANGRKTFRPLFFIVTFLLPLALFVGAAHYIDVEYTVPHEKAAAAREARLMKKMPEKIAKRNRLRAHFKENHVGKPLDEKLPLLKWSDVTTPRGQTAVENLFGESLMLHDDYLLKDVLVNRPIFVESYKQKLCYACEGIIVLLFIIGVWCGRRDRVLCMALSWFLFDMVMHMGLGFGINEVYIMAAHWTFVIPLAIAFLFKALQPAARLVLLGVCALTTCYLWCYNLQLLIPYLFPQA